MDARELYARYAAGERNFSQLTFEKIDLDVTGVVEYAPHANILDNCDFSNSIFEGTRMACVNFNGANFRSARLNDVNLWSSSMVGADFRDAIIDNSDMVAANLTEADLRRATFNTVAMDIANLTRANFQDAKLYVSCEDAICSETITPDGSICNRRLSYDSYIF